MLDVAQEHNHDEDHQEDGPVIPARTFTEIERPEVRLVDSRNPVRAPREIEGVVGREVGNDLSEAEGHDREIVAAEAQRRRSEDGAEQ